MKKLNMERLDFNTKNIFSDLKIFNFKRWYERKTLNFEKLGFRNVTRLSIAPRLRNFAQGD